MNRCLVPSLVTIPRSFIFCNQFSEPVWNWSLSHSKVLWSNSSAVIKYVFKERFLGLGSVPIFTILSLLPRICYAFTIFKYCIRRFSKHFGLLSYSFTLCQGNDSRIVNKILHSYITPDKKYQQTDMINISIVSRHL